MLPEVMQVRSKWGLKGRTKYTHLADQDTTLRGERIDDTLRARVDAKRGGLKPLPPPPTKKAKK